MKAPCPECGKSIEATADVELGEIITCDNCAAELDVVSVEPFELMVFDEDEK